MSEQRLEMANIVGYKRVFSSVTQGPGHFTRTGAKNPVATLGKLAPLPNELLDDIISKLCDIQTIVTSFSLVNRSARKTVDASLAFQRVSRYAPAALVAMLRTQVASFFTLGDLYDALCSNSCSLCGSLGLLLWLPGCQRCCMPCLRSPELCPINEYAATKLFGLSTAVLADLPTVCSESGWDDFKDFRHLLSFAHVRAVAVEDAGGEAQFTVRIDSTPQRRAVYDSFISHSNSESRHKARKKVAVTLPYVNRRSGEIVNGLSCEGCRWSMDSEDFNADGIRETCRRYDTIYTTSGLIHHVQTDCPPGQRIWKRHLERSKQGNEHNQ
ncbi:uncharacterized protein ARMOST_11596 [Armillaria ostoyae]|uniref:F-box domain-containing protein n=1 Tax=Armillaria ostoyae TaxID=47428 RepID=A0A284RHL1_ARMOS|nr:uncharacterized protein ARMOST_11596 [Armillaria ostoyae]